jgi:hypothetical protein
VVGAAAGVAAVGAAKLGALAATIAGGGSVSVAAEFCGSESADGPETVDKSPAVMFCGNPSIFCR